MFLLVHGAANSSGVWQLWQMALADSGYASVAMDLRGHGDAKNDDLAQTGMADYAADVVAAAAHVDGPVVLAGWSMGGLVALMAAPLVRPVACVLLAPSAPSRIVDTNLPLRSGVFGPEVYGITSADPDDQSAMPDLTRSERMVALVSLGSESQRARDERTRGVVVATPACPVLLATGTDDRLWPADRYRDMPFAADRVEVLGASHWGLVLNGRVVPSLVADVVTWLQGCLRQ